MVPFKTARLNKGFTLVELLAVIVILAIVLAIAVPTITGIINQAKTNAFEQDAKMIIKAIDYYFLQEPGLDLKTLNADNIGNKLDISNKNYDFLSIGLDENNKHYIYIEGRNKWADLVACGTFSSITVESKDNLEVCSNFGNNNEEEPSPFAPKLAFGMIPIKWDENREEDSKWVKADVTKEWYDYDKQEWANVVLIDSDKRNDYITADPGEYIDNNHVLVYLVWIPRYRYELFNVDKKDVTGNSEVSIIIEFETSTAVGNKEIGIKNRDWLTHPAFTFDEKELTGFWIGKFETTGEEENPTVKPGIISVKDKVSVLFNMNKKFNNLVNPGYSGLDNEFDAHMLKNMEWGAVAYLSHSKYGKTDENGDNVEVSRNDNYLCTGGGCLSEETEYQYYHEENVGQSTTGNVYGVYDMNGGATEYVMGVMYKEGDEEINTSSSGFDNEIDLPEWDKYVDKYKYSELFNDYERSQLGDATGETRGWYWDSEYFITSDVPWFVRGGNPNFGNEAGVFSFYKCYGNCSGGNEGSRLGVS